MIKYEEFFEKIKGRKIRRLDWKVGAFFIAHQLSTVPNHESFLMGVNNDNHFTVFDMSTFFRDKEPHWEYYPDTFHCTCETSVVRIKRFIDAIVFADNNTRIGYTREIYCYECKKLIPRLIMDFEG